MWTLSQYSPNFLFLGKVEIIGPKELPCAKREENGLLCTKSVTSLVIMFSSCGHRECKYYVPLCNSCMSEFLDELPSRN